MPSGVGRAAETVGPLRQDISHAGGRRTSLLYAEAFEAEAVCYGRRDVTVPRHGQNALRTIVPRVVRDLTT
jgi:hypothetical protein